MNQVVIKLLVVIAFSIYSANSQAAENKPGEWVNCDPWAKDLAPLIQAIHCGDANQVSALIENGADVNVVDDRGNSALMWAAEFKHLKIARLLLEKGANPNFKNKAGATPLMFATSVIAGENIAMLQLLISHGSAVEAKDNLGRSAIQYIRTDKENGKMMTDFLRRAKNIQAQPRTNMK